MKFKGKKGKVSIILNTVLVIIAIIVIYQMWHIYKLNDFGNFIKAEYSPNVSFFSRDDNIRYSDSYSYKIESKDYNDALIYRTIDVEKETVYKITAMVKFENVENQTNDSNAGVNIGIMDTTEKSNSLVGTGDWQPIYFKFNSKNRTNIDIVFRLGSYDGNSKGTVWFSDFTLEKGEKDTSNNWNFVCLIMKNLEVKTQKDGVSIETDMQLRDTEIELVNKNMKRFQTSIKETSRRVNDCYI